MAQPPPLPGFHVAQPQQQYQPVYPSYPAPHMQQPVAQPFLPPNTMINTNQQWLTNTTLGSFLTSSSSFHVKQQVEALEILTGWETNNKYSIKDQAGNKLFYAAEYNDCCTANICGAHRPFDMRIKDIYGQDVLCLQRPLRCSSCFCPCFLQEINVNTAQGQTVGKVVQEWSLCQPSFSIRNPANQPVLNITGPFCPFACGGSVVFSLEALNGAKVGVISKEWGGLVREMFTDADYFSVSFPVDLDLNTKATCLGALFLIDYMYFESKGRAKLKFPW